MASFLLSGIILAKKYMLLCETGIMRGGGGGGGEGRGGIRT